MTDRHHHTVKLELRYTPFLCDLEYPAWDPRLQVNAIDGANDVTQGPSRPGFSRSQSIFDTPRTGLQQSGHMQTRPMYCHRQRSGSRGVLVRGREKKNKVGTEYKLCVGEVHNPPFRPWALQRDGIPPVFHVENETGQQYYPRQSEASELFNSKTRVDPGSVTDAGPE